MNKNFKYFLTILMFLLITFISTSKINVIAADLNYIIEFTEPAFVYDDKEQIGDYTWFVENSWAEYYDDETGMEFVVDYQKREPVRLYTEGHFYKITSISMTAEWNNSLGEKVEIFIDGNLMYEFMPTMEFETYTYNLPTPTSGNVEFKFTFTSFGLNDSIHIKGFEINYTEIPITVTGSNYASVSIPLNLTVNNVPDENTIVWESSDETKATVSNGVVIPIAPGPVDITARLADDKYGFYTKSIYVLPTENREISMPDIKKYLSDIKQQIMPFSYAVIGYISSIDIAYNETKDTISITISDGTNYMSAASLKGGSELSVGDTVRITGDIALMQGRYIFGSNALYIKLANPDLINNKSIISNANAYMSIGFKYNYEEIEPFASDVLKVPEDIAENYYLTEETNNAINIGMNEELYNISAVNNNSNGVLFSYHQKAIRIFSTNGSDSENGAKMIIETKNNQIIESIDIEFREMSNRSTDFTINGTKGDYNTTNYVINDTKVEIHNICPDYQIWILSITINLDENTGESIIDYSNVDIRIRMGVDSTISNITNADDYGIEVFTTSKSNKYSKDNDQLWSIDNNNEVNYIVISLGDVFNNIERYTTEFTVRGYFEKDNVKYDSSLSKTYSLKTLLEEYINNVELGELEKEMINDLYSRLESLNK